MPETRKEKVSGSEPGEIQPTLIRAVEKKMDQPTEFEPRATVIQAVVSHDSRATQEGDFGPTVITSSVNDVRTPSGSADIGLTVIAPSQSSVQGAVDSSELREKSDVIEAPTVIRGGKIYKNLDVKEETLKKMFPLLSSEMILAIREILNATSLETLSEERCIRWGSTEQERYGVLVKRSMESLENRFVQDGIKHLARLHSILQKIADAFHDSNDFFAIFKAQADPVEKYRNSEKEIKQLSESLCQLLPEIINKKTEAGTGLSELSDLTNRLEAKAFAASYLSQLLIEISGKEIESQRLYDRSVSLTKTVTSIRQGAATRRLTDDKIMDLASMIQDGVLVKLPAWIEQVGNAKQLRSLTETEQYAIQTGLIELNQDLKNFQ